MAKQALHARDGIVTRVVDRDQDVDVGRHGGVQWSLVYVAAAQHRDVLVKLGTGVADELLEARAAAARRVAEQVVVGGLVESVKMDAVPLRCEAFDELALLL